MSRHESPTVAHLANMIHEHHRQRGEMPKHATVSAETMAALRREGERCMAFPPVDCARGDGCAKFMGVILNVDE